MYTFRNTMKGEKFMSEKQAKLKRKAAQPEKIKKEKIQGLKSSPNYIKISKMIKTGSNLLRKKRKTEAFAVRRYICI